MEVVTKATYYDTAGDRSDVDQHKEGGRHGGRNVKLLDSIGGKVSVRKEIAQGLENVANLEHPESRKVDKVETDTTNSGRLGQWDSGLEEVQEGCRQ